MFLLSYGSFFFQQDENAAKRDDLKSEPEKATAVGDNGGEKTVNEMNSNTVEPMDEKSDKEKKDDDKQSDSDSVKEYVVDKEALQVTSMMSWLISDTIFFIQSFQFLHVSDFLSVLFQNRLSDISIITVWVISRCRCIASHLFSFRLIHKWYCGSHGHLLCLLQVEDLRCLLHNLGKFLSHRDVKVRFLHSPSQRKRTNTTSLYGFWS